MFKSKEDFDLSRDVLEMDLESPIFKKMREQLDSAIKDCIKVAYNNEFEGGDITLKLGIELPETYKIIPREDPATEEMINEKYWFEKPRFKHKVTITLSKKQVLEGQYSEDREVEFDVNDDIFIAKKIDDKQINMFDKQ